METNADVWLPKGNPWIIAIAVSLAAFMEVLDMLAPRFPAMCGNATLAMLVTMALETR
jgi:hypothetical protein